MSRSAIIGGLLALLAAIGALVFFGARGLERDRADLHARFAAARMQVLEEAATELARDVEKIGEDLELAAALVSQTTSAEARARELHAIATVTREYLGIELRDADGASLVRVVAPDSDILDRAAAAIDETTRVARARPGAFLTSPPLGMVGDLAWFRVFARRSPTSNDLVVAIVVDMRPLLARLRLLEDSSSALLVIGAHGRPAPSSHPILAAKVATRGDPATGPGLTRLMTHVRDRVAGTETLAEAEARALGLPAASAIAVTTPVRIEDGEPWALALVASTTALRSQERTVVRRLVAGGVLVGLVLVALSFYFVSNARRAVALRERLRHADRLAHLTDKAEKILDHIPTGVLALTEDGRVSDVNRWLSERLGRDVRGAEVEAVFPDLDPARVGELRALIDAARASREVRSLHRVELSLWGTPARVNLHAVPLARRFADVHVLLVVEDLEPLRRIEDRLLHSEKLVTAGQLAAGIAHEIGTPLNVVRGRAELALARLPPGDPQAAGQKVILEQVDHVSRLITQLLDYVRPAPPASHAVEAGDAVRRVTELLAAEAGKRDVRLVVEIAPATPPLRADPDQLRQVLVNLTVNALDACERGGVVTVRARPAGAAVALEVEDDGAGIDPALHAQVFDPFFTTKKRGRGTGLGLWVVAQLVRAHHGEIELDSTPGAGTLVRILWPAHASNPVVAASPAR